jgi:cytidylate kinase
MAVITLSGELGSNSREIARAVAQTLRYELVDKHTYDGIFRQYGLTRFEDVYNSAPSFLDLLNADNLLLVSMANEIVEAVAQRGNVVIVGRAGFAALAGYADVLHVHIQAPLAERVQRVMTRDGLSDPRAAEERVSEDDHMRRSYVQRFYNTQWDEPANFDLVIDTSAESSEQAVQRIVEAATALDQRTVAQDARTTAQIAADPVLADAVAEALANPLPVLPESENG